MKNADNIKLQISIRELHKIALLDSSAKEGSNRLNLKESKSDFILRIFDNFSPIYFYTGDRL